MSFVSVITPAFHAEETIADTVRSVIAQTHKRWEMIIISDDGQDYERILRSRGIKDARLRFTATDRVEAGPGVGRNKGLESARYDIIANLDADDAYSENFLSALLPHVSLHGACTSAVRVIDAVTGEPLPSCPILNTGRLYAMQDVMRYCPSFAPIIFNRRWCEARWPALHYGEDLLFWLLLMDSLPGIYFVPAARYDYRFRKGSLSRPDEETTHGLCQRRTRMMEWLDRSAEGSRANRSLLKCWLSICNAMEEQFDYQLVDIDIYLREINARFGGVFGRFEAVCNLGYS